MAALALMNHHVRWSFSKSKSKSKSKSNIVVPIYSIPIANPIKTACVNNIELKSRQGYGKFQCLYIVYCHCLGRSMLGVCRAVFGFGMDGPGIPSPRDRTFLHLNMGWIRMNRIPQQRMPYTKAAFFAKGDTAP